MKAWAHTRAREQAWHQVCVPTVRKHMDMSRFFFLTMMSDAHRGKTRHRRGSRPTCGSTSSYYVGEKKCWIWFIHSFFFITMVIHFYGVFLPCSYVCSQPSTDSKGHMWPWKQEMIKWISDHVTYIIWQVGNSIFHQGKCTYQKFMDSEYWFFATNRVKGEIQNP